MVPRTQLRLICVLFGYHVAFSTAQLVSRSVSTSPGWSLVLQIIQHSGPLPVLEGGSDSKPVLSRRPERQVSDITMLRSRSKNSSRPQHQEAGNVEGILTLQLSHPNVVQTFKAATRPLQVFCLSLGLHPFYDQKDLLSEWCLLVCVVVSMWHMANLVTVVICTCHAAPQLPPPPHTWLALL